MTESKYWPYCSSMLCEMETRSRYSSSCKEQLDKQMYKRQRVWIGQTLEIPKHGRGVSQTSRNLVLLRPKQVRGPKSGFFHFNWWLKHHKVWLGFVLGLGLFVLSKVSVCYASSRTKKLFNWYASTHLSSWFSSFWEKFSVFQCLYLEDSAIFVCLMTGSLQIVQWTIHNLFYTFRSEWS